MALLHSIHTIRKKVTVLRFPRKYEPEKSFMCFKFITQCDCRKQACKGGLRPGGRKSESDGLLFNTAGVGYEA